MAIQVCNKIQYYLSRLQDTDIHEKLHMNSKISFLQILKLKA